MVTAMVPDPAGSGAIPVLHHAELEGLCRRHEVTLVTTVGDEPGEAPAVERLRGGDPPLELHLVDRRRPPPGSRRWRRQARLASRWARGGWPWRTVWYLDPAAQDLLDRLVAGREFDVIAVDDNAMSALQLPATTPAVLTQNEVLAPRPVDWRAGPPWRWPGWALRELDWRRWAGFQREAWRRFDLIQVYSERDARQLAGLAPEAAAQVRVNPFGIVIPEAPAPGSEVPGTVLFVGHFAHPPNRDAAIWLAREIMPAVRARQPAARLRIVGTAPPPEVLELRGPAVDVVADAPRIEPHLGAASVVAAPVRAGGGMRMKVLQALAAGKAVVTTRLGAEGYTSFDPAPPFVVADGDVEIAAATSDLLADGPRRRDLGRRAREFAERHHSPEAWAGRLETVYEEARELHAGGARA